MVHTRSAAKTSVVPLSAIPSIRSRGRASRLNTAVPIATRAKMMAAPPRPYQRYAKLLDQSEAPRTPRRTSSRTMQEIDVQAARTPTFVGLLLPSLERDYAASGTARAPRRRGHFADVAQVGRLAATPRCQIRVHPGVWAYFCGRGITGRGYCQAVRPNPPYPRGSRPIFVGVAFTGRGCNRNASPEEDDPIWRRTAS
jgi:hypothetical protein